ncbi:fluoride efflux transporter FluC [Phycicoccus duodecadis]|uniref:Fluoride-specific ion channel FluC n=1 Tax=Phycicoccus duodecadis TaxID=173053 RepID=A0A2N3YIV9_9MICO|nr:CrcB family protein [Phycicoccus duodecadis]PKW26787.1 CrcB protein [Phycicoccus duodecadis]
MPAREGAFPDARLLGAVAAGGVLGSLGRWAVGLALPHTAGGMPWATVVVNVTGAFAMGLLVAFLVDRPGVHRLLRPFVGVGMLGGWTTFSTLAVDVVQLGAADRVPVLLGYLVGTLVVGVAAVGAGAALGRRVWPGP